MMTDVELDVSRNGRLPMRFPLSTHRVTLGASGECDLSLSGDSIVQDVHVILDRSHGTWQVEAVDQAPVYLNGVGMTAATALAVGDRLSIGSWTIELKLATPIETPDEDELYLKGHTKVLSASERPLMRGPFVLRWLDRDGNPMAYKLKDDRVIIGKSSLCDVVLTDEYVSGRHCELFYTGDSYVLRDLDSTNGTLVNELRVKEIRLEEGAEIQCGKTKLMLVAIERGRRSRDRRHPWTIPLLGQSSAFENLAQQIERIAPLPQNVFIHGETGTGKELVAAALHELSQRKSHPFIALNCGAISKELMESELFGHEKGAFTGAQQRRIGAFELAAGGTLFLDEVGELPIDLQPKLLRVLETGRFRRVGGRDELKVDVRVFSATHRDLGEAIRMGRFREDLYYRLYILPVELPALRQRLEDIPLLVDFFISQACPADRHIEVAREVYTLLKTHEWPGNVRELRNLVYRALAFCDGGALKQEHILPFFTPTRIQPSADPLNATQLLLSPIKQKEREAIVEILKTCHGNQSLAAKKLGIGRTTLYYKIKEYGIDMRRQAVM